MAPANFIPKKLPRKIFIHRNSTGILKTIAKRQQSSSTNERILTCHISKNGLKVTVLVQSANFFLPSTLKITGSTISTPKSYDEHPRQVKYGSPPPPPHPVRKSQFLKRFNREESECDAFLASVSTKNFYKCLISISAVCRQFHVYCSLYDVAVSITKKLKVTVQFETEGKGQNRLLAIWID